MVLFLNFKVWKSEISSWHSSLCRHGYVCIVVTWDSFLNEPKIFVNKGYDIPILTKKITLICCYSYSKTSWNLFLNLRRFLLSLRLFLACSYFFAQFEPRGLIKLFLYIKKHVDVYKEVFLKTCKRLSPMFASGISKFSEQLF